MDILAIDQSKSSLGWARWSSDQQRPVWGSKKLGSEYTSRGDVYVSLHKFFGEQSLFGKPDLLVVESPVDPKHIPHPTKFENDRQLIGLAEWSYYWAAITGTKIHEVSPAIWHFHFTNRRHPKKDEGIHKKEPAMKTCRRFGFKPENYDESDAIGILHYGIEAIAGLTPPWRTDRLPLGSAA